MFFLCFVQGKTQPGPSPMDSGPCCSENHGRWHHMKPSDENSQNIDIDSLSKI